MRACSLLIAFYCLVASIEVRAEAPRSGIDFNRDVRPILSDNCFKCHGPDDTTRKAKLRLDIPGQFDKDELLQRIMADDEKRMPPLKSGKNLSPAQVETLRRWLAGGATYSQHWAFQPPVQPALPAVKQTTWPRNPVDYFILSRLEREGLKPSPEADRITLLRRVTLDLTGLPPTPAEVDAFLADKSSDAYERVVDRLLNSVRYGERMAVEWLDAARYADTHGYHIDSGRDMTPWRDWVIRSFNRNLPFDQFTIQQLAGDLLPNATLENKVASGFNRNHMINFEGGAIPEEYHAAYIIDRVNTTGTVWLGLTIGCAQCHDHKYDPLSQKEYYQLYAFFHNVPEKGLDGNTGNAAPLLRMPSAEQTKRLENMTNAIRELDERLSKGDSEHDAAQARWEERLANSTKANWTTLTPREATSRGGARLEIVRDGGLRVGGANPTTDVYVIKAPMPVAGVTALRLETLPDRAFNENGPGRSINGNIVLTDLRLTVGDQTLKVTGAAADFSQRDFPIAYAIDDDPRSGWAIHPEMGKPHTAVFELAQPAPAGELTITLAFESQFARHQLGRFRLAVTTAGVPHDADLVPNNIRTLARTPAAKRNRAQKEELRTYFRTHHSPEFQRMNEQRVRLRQQQQELEKQIPTTMVMEEMAKPRDTFILMRGQYDKKGEKVAPAVPAIFPTLPADSPGNRLGLARWLVSPQHPLTARVTVNRYWQMYFGNGLVKTAEDFGSQGEWPSHPELLDWLATEFIKTGWDVKGMQRLLVTSATYRQSSKARTDLMTKDPDNRLLARMPRLRLAAEFIRDQALAVSGLLNGEVGGRSVSPYQPAGLWEELASREDGRNWTAQTYEQSKGKDLYRRTMYTFWKRTSPPPTLVTFDAPDRETCTVRRARTNTPLQALVLLNDPTYVEASRKLAERLLREGKNDEARLTLAFRLTTARTPDEAEQQVLRRLLTVQREKYQNDKPAATKLLGVGESPRDSRWPVEELAAWTMIASTVLNLDEAVTRN